MEQRPITSEIHTYLQLLIFNVREYSSEIKQEVLCWPHFIFDLRVELEDRSNQYKVLSPFIRKLYI